MTDSQQCSTLIDTSVDTLTSDQHTSVTVDKKVSTEQKADVIMTASEAANMSKIKHRENSDANFSFIMKRIQERVNAGHLCLHITFDWVDSQTIVKLQEAGYHFHTDLVTTICWAPNCEFPRAHWHRKEDNIVKPCMSCKCTTTSGNEIIQKSSIRQPDFFKCCIS